MIHHGQRRPVSSAKKCSMCGSKRWHIRWDPANRTWCCERAGREPEPKPAPRLASTTARTKPAKPPAPEPDPIELPEATPLACEKCGAVLLAHALPGVAAYCRRCRRWSG